MKWINDRKPQTPGMYAIRHKIVDCLESFSFAYFDGKGWLAPSESGSDIAPYRSDPEWSVIDWGRDLDDFQQLLDVFR